MSFWSLILEPGKKYEKEVENGIQVTRATLDTSQSSTGNDGIVQIILDYEGKEMTVANLSVKHGIFQSSLDLTFKEGDRVAFSTSGAKLPVSLTGVAGLEDDEDDDLDEDELEHMDEFMEQTEEDDEDAPELVAGSKKRKLEVAEKFRRPAKSAKLINGAPKPLTLNGESFMSDDEDDEPYNPTADLSSMGEELLGDEEELDDEDLDSDDDDDEDVDQEDDDDEDDEDDSEEEEEEESQEAPAQSKKSSKMNGVMESPKQKKKELSKLAKQPEVPKSGKKEQKTPAKEARKSLSSAAAGEAKTPSEEKVKSPKESKLAKAMKLEAKETPKSEKKKQPKENKGTPQQKQDSVSPKKQMRSGGVVIEDISLGTGEAAKKGSNVSMYYVGRLKSNNKVFDSQLSGAPLKFVLGRGEVIAGWDVGLAGMKVGGKRKLSIPSGMAYGKKGAPPDIPPQAHLEFEVTMITCR